MPIIVNKEQCKKVAKKIGSLNHRKNFFQREFITFNSDTETKLRTYFYATAICHQTYGLTNKEKNLDGWSWIEVIYTQLGKDNSKLIDPKYLASLRIEDLAEKIRSLFSEDGNPCNCLLKDVEGRSKILIESSKLIISRFDGKISNLISSSNGFLINKGTGIYEQLDNIPGFEDPLKKKATLFVGFLMDAGLLDIKDKENISPLTDYHIQRLLLRTGCLEITDNELRNNLINQNEIDSDSEIRIASIEAIKILTKESDKSIFFVTDFLWALSRGCCRYKVLCKDKSCNKEPCTFYLIFDIKEHKSCFLEGACEGETSLEHRKIWEPRVKTCYY